MITAVGIKRILYADTDVVKTDLTGAALKTIIESATEITNVHGDTWSFEEADPSVTKHKNALTGGTYRIDKEMGDVAMNFTIGQYDYKTKADLMGGDATEKNWKRARGVVNITKCLIAKTEDDQWIVFPNGTVVARTATTDKGIGLAVAGTAMEPTNPLIRSEYWFDDSEVKAVGE